MLANEEDAGYGHHPHVNAGRKHMSSTETRVSVIVGVCQQDPKRWSEFNSIYRPMLLAYLCKRGLSESDASDVVQDIFVKLLAKIHTYDREKFKFRSWLFSVAHNTLIDHARRRATHRKAVDGWADQMLSATPSDSVRMTEEWTKIHREKILEHALKTVRSRTSSKVWACFEQRLLRNRPAADIAAELKIQPNAVYVNASRVLKQVRAVCDEFDEDISHGFEGVSEAP
jgi:RNA polymerase sigma-70 factor (ECF subfamily)